MCGKIKPDVLIYMDCLNDLVSIDVVFFKYNVLSKV